MRLPMKLLVLSVGLSLALAASGTAQTPKPLRVTIPVIGMNFLPVFVAADKGMFAKRGLMSRLSPRPVMAPMSTR